VYPVAGRLIEPSTMAGGAATVRVKLVCTDSPTLSLIEITIV